MQLHRQSAEFVVTCYERLRAAGDEQCRCRQCGVYCPLFTNICQSCGTQDPVRLPFTWLCYATAIIVLLATLGALVF